MQLRSITAALVILLLSHAAIGRAADDAEPPQPEVDRTDLAAAYLRLEHAWFADPPTEADFIATANQTFDVATRAFFTGDFSDAVRDLNAITASLNKLAPSNTEQLAASLAATADPPVLKLDNPAPVKLRFRSLYTVDQAVAIPTTILLLLRDTAGNVAHQQPVTFTPDDDRLVDFTVDVSTGMHQAAPAVYAIELSVSADPPVPLAPAGRLVVVEKSLDAHADHFTRRLEAVTPTDDAHRHALDIARARVGLLSDDPSPDNSAQFLGDPLNLLDELTSEVAAIEAGKNPYHRRAGDHWRIVAGGEDDIPLRVYAPESILDRDEPLPLLIAFHGAGGDENMFLEAYGVGIIKQLADRHGLLLASPSTYAFGRDEENLDRLLASLAHDYELDPSRLYILGHSMGAGATIRLASARPDQITAACSLAGSGRFRRVDAVAPLLMIFAELDGIIPSAPAARGADAGIEKGLPIEKRILPHFGHTLMVGTSLPDAVAWLVDHR